MIDEILFRYYINTALLVYINISNTQKWAGGHAVPSRYVAYTYIYKKYLGDTLFPRFYIPPTFFAKMDEKKPL